MKKVIYNLDWIMILVGIGFCFWGLLYTSDKNIKDCQKAYYDYDHALTTSQADAAKQRMILLVQKGKCK